MLDISNEDFETLPIEQKRRALSLANEQEARQAQRLFFEIYPEQDQVWAGPSLMGGLVETGQTLYSRYKYPKHMEWLGAGAQYRERCAMMANRCITPWTYLETPVGEVLSAEAWTLKDVSMLSWDGESQCDAQAQGGYLKGIEPAFRVVMDNGRFFDCSRKHRVLTSEGWLSLDRLVSLASGLRCWQRREDYQASCVGGGYLGDQPLQSIADIDLAQPPSRDGVQGRAPLVFEITDAMAHILQCIRACPQPDRLSTRDGLRRFADLFALFSGASSAQSFLSIAANNQAVSLLASELAPHLPEVCEPHCDQCGGDALRVSGPTACLDESCTRIMLNAKRQSGAQWCDAQLPGGSVQEWFRDAAHIPIFYPSFHPDLVGGETIAAIVPIGLQPIIDAHVPVFNNYRAGGVYHHNSGKTFGLGGYEMSCHLTGLYPDFWDEIGGRRFKNPISAWAAGDTYETTRDIIQLTLLGDIGFRDGRKVVDGRGIIPGHLLGRNTWRSGVQDLVDTIVVKHVSGGNSFLGFKSFDQGRKKFQGTGRHVIWFDEEPPMDVYNEALIRTATLGGIIMLTFTPLSGLSEVVLSFMPADMRPDITD